jgi:hypothetical protein
VHIYPAPQDVDSPTRREGAQKPSSRRGGGDLCTILHPNFGDFPFRDCMKSGCRRVFRYSSTHEKEIPDGSIRRRMEPHRSPHASPHRTSTAEVPRPSRDPERRLLPPKERLPMATAPPRLPQVAHRLVVLQEMAHRRDLGAPQSGPPRTPPRRLRGFAEEVGGGAHDRLDRPQQEDEQRLRKVVCERGGVGVRCHEIRLMTRRLARV